VQVEATRITTQDALTTALQPIQAAIESLRQTQFQQQGEKSAKTEGVDQDRWMQGFQQAQQMQTQFKSQFESQQDEQRVAVVTQARQWRTGTVVGIVGASVAFLSLLVTLVVVIIAHLP
jgi:hypothetical protein